MTEEKPIDCRFLQTLLRDLEAKAHDVYAVMCGLPKAHVFLCRFYDHANRVDGCDDPAANTFSIREFYDRFGTFHPKDEFGICFAVHLDRIDSARAGEYVERICLGTRREATVGGVRETLSIFLESYCEYRLRKNRPFGLTPAVVDRFGLTSDDVEVLGRLLDRYNAAAKKMIRAEYAALQRLDFIRNKTKM